MTKSRVICIVTGAFLGFLTLCVVNKQSAAEVKYDLPKPNPKPRVVHLDTFSVNNLKKELDTLNIQHSDIVFNQARLETGNFKSHVFKNYHNLFGFVGKKGYIKYSDWKESVKAYKVFQSKHYKSGDYYT